MISGNYIYRGTKFNSRVETVKGEKYLGTIPIRRFYIRCTKCVATITFRTDPENQASFLPPKLCIKCTTRIMRWNLEQRVILKPIECGNWWRSGRPMQRPKKKRTTRWLPLKIELRNRIDRWSCKKIWKSYTSWLRKLVSLKNWLAQIIAINFFRLNPC